jgi:hypothetical protein
VAPLCDAWARSDWASQSGARFIGEVPPCLRGLTNMTKVNPETSQRSPIGCVRLLKVLAEGPRSLGIAGQGKPAPAQGKLTKGAHTPGLASISPTPSGLGT